MSSILLGRQEATQTPVYLKEAVRTRGMYILGAPGTGKSNLIELMILSDIQEGNGVFFLDPHGEAIDNIIKYVKTPQESSVTILDPEDEKYSFGINLLACRDLASLKERTDTYTRAYNIFYKLWKNILDERPWLQLIVQNTLLALLENPGFTLAEMALFLTDENFRDQLASNIKYNSDVRDFWLNRFRNKRGSDQQRQVDAALSRINTLLGQPYIRHIIGQTKTTIDFQQVLADRKVVFLKLSAALSPDIKKFIGTIVISELLHAVRNRPQDRRGLFCAYIDEFQNFANSEDLAIFITEARKFAIATTIAHQERFGQLSDSKKMQGAILAAALKIYFQLTIKDAEELAGEFAREPPPAEIRLEEQVAISQNPVSDLLRAHRDPEICAFVNKYLRPLQERTEDIRGDVDLERLIRDDYRDKAAIERIIAQINAPRDRYSSDRAQLDALQTAMSSLLFARSQTEKLASLYQSSKELRQTIRGFNKFLTGIMEGRIKPGQEVFSQFLIAITRVHEFSLVPKEYAPLLELYLTLQYGDPQKAPAIPFALAHAHGLFSNAVSRLIGERDEKIKQHRQEYFKKSRDALRQRQAEEVERQERDKKEKAEKAKAYLASCRESLYYTVENLLKYYIFMHMDKGVKQALEPYYTARFTPQWRDRHAINISLIIREVLKGVESERNRLNEARKYKDEYNQKWFTLRPTITGGYKLIDRRYFQIQRTWTFKSGELTEGKDYQVQTHNPFILVYKPLNPLFWRCGIKYLFEHEFGSWPILEDKAEYLIGRYGPMFEDFLLDDFQKWLTEYSEGAVGVLFLLKTVFGSGWPDSYKLTFDKTDKEYMGYRYNSLHIPALMSRDALEVFLLLDKLCAIISGISSIRAKCARYYWLADGQDPYEKYFASTDGQKEWFSRLIFNFNDPERISKGLLKDLGLEWFDKQLQDRRFFEKLREEGNYQWWFALGGAARTYSLTN